MASTPHPSPGHPEDHCYDATLQGRNYSRIVSLPGKVLELRPDKYGTPVGQPFREQQRLTKHVRRRNLTTDHSGQPQHHGPQFISTGDTVLAKGQIGCAVIKTGGTKPQISAKIAERRLVARRPGNYNCHRECRWLLEHIFPPAIRPN